MDLLQHLVVQIRRQLLRNLVANLRFTRWRDPHISRSRMERLPVDLLQHIQNEILVEVVLALLQSVFVHHYLRITGGRERNPQREI